ncbi:MAG: TrkH family potassium uptake protein [Candidatus Aenigmarchaeota archaeon]|nr:TrkH family potassium uptake protein [Candidatus Aenigmarchaeota archaeon]MCK5372857.1 TrkH family potassium uptake protein [Candidatus Aenigmarchaeota archaeon]
MKSVMAYMGLLLEIFSIFLILPIIVSYIYGEPATPFFAAFTIAIFMGIFLEKYFERESLDLSRGLVLTALTFIMFSILGAIPFMLMEGGSSMHPIDAVFESVSGFTTTGLTVFSDVETLPKSILFWRSETQWIGGMGIIILFLSILSGLKTSSLALYSAQGYSERIEPTIKETTQKMVKIYGTYSILGFSALYLSGLPVFEAITTMFSAISTGGFTVVNVFYTSSWTLAVVSILMILGSINFIIHDKIFKKKFDMVRNNVEIRSFFITLAIFILVAYTTTRSLEISVFQMISAMTATGFSITNVSMLAPVLIFITIIAMVVGSSSGSTAGGIKQLRIILALKSVAWAIKKTTLPKDAVIPLKLNGEQVKDDIARITQVFIFTYLAILGLGALSLMFYGYTPIASIFQVASAMGTVGMSVINVGASEAGVKAILMACMFLGRLEIFPIFVIIEKMIMRR